MLLTNLYSTDFCDVNKVYFNSKTFFIYITVYHINPIVSSLQEEKGDEKYKILLHYLYKFLIEIDNRHTEVPCHTKYVNINLHDVYLITREAEATPIEQPL